MSFRDITNRIILATNEAGTTRLLDSGLTSSDTVICEDVDGWNELDNISHDIRQATFPTASSAGVYVGSTYTPKSELGLTLVYTSTNAALASVSAVNALPLTQVFWLQVVEASGTRIAGYRVRYSGFSIDDFFNEGCRVTFRFTSEQALATEY